MSLRPSAGGAAHGRATSADRLASVLATGLAVRQAVEFSTNNKPSAVDVDGSPLVLDNNAIKKAVEYVLKEGGPDYVHPMYGPIGSWDVSEVTDMSYLFQDATSFNGDLSGWEFPKVTHMEYMFDYATSFEGKGVSKWTFPEVTNMDSMFAEATSFNGDVSNWTFPNVTNMSFMFVNATSFRGRFSNEAIDELRSRGVKVPGEASGVQ